jgi:hypothetical protein
MMTEVRGSFGSTMLVNDSESFVIYGEAIWCMGRLEGQKNLHDDAIIVCCMVNLSLCAAWLYQVVKLIGVWV